MSLPKFNPRSTALLIIVLLIGIMRFAFIWNNELSPLSNFSPVGAMAIFSGAYMSSAWKKFAFPLLTLFVSDLILSYTVHAEFRTGFLYGGWYWTYGAFALMTLASTWLVKKVNVLSLLGASVAAVFIHWIVTDLGVWWGSTMYAQTLSGYILCLIAAIPFEFNLFAGTVLYGSILFGGFELMQKKYPVLSLPNA